VCYFVRWKLWRVGSVGMLEAIEGGPSCGVSKCLSWQFSYYSPSRALSLERPAEVFAGRL
jgi:hypothetical protein